jgi:cytochrome P450
VAAQRQNLLKCGSSWRAMSAPSSICARKARKEPVINESISEQIADPLTYRDPRAMHELFTTLRREAPVRWTEPAATRPFWLLTRHADILEVERQADIFVSGPRLELFSIEQENRIRAAHEGRAAVSRTLLHMDGLEHRNYRGITQTWFMPARMKKLEQDLAELATEYVDALAKAGGETDFVNSVAVWYPLRVILMILGLPPGEAPELLRLTRAFVSRDQVSLEGKRGTREDILVDAGRQIFEYFGAVYRERRAHPRDDLASVIAQATIDGQPIGALEAMSYYLLVGLAGHDTTNSTIGGGMLALIENPGEREKLRAHPELLPLTSDEMFRWVSPVRSFMRTATRDYVLSGQTIKTGDAILMSFSSANRDETVFEAPFAFKVDRKPNPHLAFGFGAHVCLGQHLARMELRALFGELLRRIEHVELAGTPAWLAGVTSGSLTQLPIRYRFRN